jgi:putative MATE family efflux protein
MKTAIKIIMRKFIQLIKQSFSSETYDFTQGSIRKAIALLAIPMILELGLESVFAVVDMLVVAKLGEAAIQTVGLTESVITLVYSIAIGLSTAATVLVARRVGEKNFTEASKAGAQVFYPSIISTILLSLPLTIFAPEILHVMGATPATVSVGTPFTRIMFGTSGVITLLFVINGVFRGAGNAAIAMKSLWLASGINIILCPLFVHGLQWGLTGAALATVVGRSTGVIYQIWCLKKGSDILKIKKEYIQFNKDLVKQIINIAWPATLQYLIASGSWIVLAIVVARTATAGDETASAGYQIAIRNIVFFILPAWGLSNAAATLVGQNLGAQKPERAERSVLLCTRYNVIFMGLVTILFVFFNEQIIRLFTSDDAIVKIGAKALFYIGFGYVFYGIGMVMMQALNGSGDTKTPTWINFFGFWLIQVPLAIFLAYNINLKHEGVFMAIPISETIIALSSFYYFKLGKWKTVKV